MKVVIIMSIRQMKMIVTILDETQQFVIIT